MRDHCKARSLSHLEESKNKEAFVAISLCSRPILIAPLICWNCRSRGALFLHTFEPRSPDTQYCTLPYCTTNLSIFTCYSNRETFTHPAAPQHSLIFPPRACLMSITTVRHPVGQWLNPRQPCQPSHRCNAILRRSEHHLVEYHFRRLVRSRPVPLLHWRLLKHAMLFIS